MTIETQQPGLPLDYGESDRRTAEGVEKVAASESAYLTTITEAITRIAQTFRTFTSDDLYREIGELPAGVHRNIVGAAFHRHPLIRKTGDFIKSDRPAAHSRVIAIWTLRRVEGGSAIQLGQTVRDTISGFQGKAVSRTEYLYGCVRFGVQPMELRDGKRIDLDFFDEPQLEIIDDTPAAAPAVRGHGDRPPPVGRHDPR